MFLEDQSVHHENVKQKAKLSLFQAHFVCLERLQKKPKGLASQNANSFVWDELRGGRC